MNKIVESHSPEIGHEMGIGVGGLKGAASRMNRFQRNVGSLFANPWLPKIFRLVILYSDIVDEKLVAELQISLSKSLEPFPSCRFQVTQVYCDDKRLGNDPTYANTIHAGVLDADYLLLCVSSKAARSRLMMTEVTSWIRERSADDLGIIVTEGELAWDSAATDFDWKRTTVLSRQLRGLFPAEPLSLDMRPARDMPKLSVGPAFGYLLPFLNAKLGKQSQGALSPQQEFIRALQHSMSHRLVGEGVVSSRKAPDPVYLGASAPSQVKSGEEFTARFVAYRKDLENQVLARLSKLSRRSEQYLGLKKCIWKSGTPVKLRCEGRHIQVESAEEGFIWQGGYNVVDFDVLVPPKAPACVTVLKFDIFIAGIIVAKLRLDLEIGIGSGSHRLNQLWSKSTAHSAFASYAAADRPRVLDRVAELVNVASIDVFVDCLSLHPGEKWKPHLVEEIRHREFFLLFWSANAKRSSWVKWEWQTALREKGLGAIDPHPLDLLTKAKPPRALKSLHFSDPYMLARVASEKK
jgi:hypothetical protein